MTWLLFSYFWFVMPYYALMIVNNKSYERDFINKWLSKGWGRHLLPLLLVAMTFVGISMGYFAALPEEPNCRRFCIHESIVLQLVFGFCMVTGIATLLSGIFWWLKNFKIIHFTQSYKGEAK